MLPFLEKDDFDIMEYVEILNKRKWVIVICVMLGIIAGTVHLAIVPRIYRADTVLLVEGGVPKITSIRNDIYSSGRGDMRTQLSILNSRYLAERVAKRMGLPMDPKSIDRLLKAVGISLTGNIIIVSASGVDPPLITNIANTWVKEFIRQDIERRMGTTEYGVIWLEDQLAETLRELQDVEAQLAVLTKKNTMVAELEDDLAGLKNKKKNLEIELAGAARGFGELHPKIIFLNKAIEQTRKDQEEIRERLITFHDELWEYRRLNDKVGLSRGLYNSLLTRVQELDISKDLSVTNIRIVDVAKIPTRPISPKPEKTIPPVIFAGLLAGLGIVLLLEFLDSTLKHPEDVEVYANMPFLGFAPSVRRERRKGQDINLLSQKDPYSQVAEAFRNIKVALIFSSSEEKSLNKLIITSANPKDGKTFVAANLAEILAHANENTLLIDADMKRGKLAKTFNVTGEVGLTSVLAGVSSLEKAVVQTSVPNLSLLPSGPSAPNPSELLSSGKFKEAIEGLGSKFQRIIIDVPAILSTSDALFWGEVADGMIQVIGGGVTPLKALKEARKIMEGKIAIIGGVLNNLEVKKNLKYYYHYFQEFAKRSKKREAKKKEEKKKK